jgi:hypothetical protein
MLGSPARVKVLAINQRVTPELLGRSPRYPRTPVEIRNRGTPFCTVRADIPKAAFENRTAKDHARYASRNLLTEDRTSLQYLVKPFCDQISRHLVRNRYTGTRDGPFEMNTLLQRAWRSFLWFSLLDGHRGIRTAPNRATLMIFLNLIYLLNVGLAWMATVAFAGAFGASSSQWSAVPIAQLLAVCAISIAATKWTFDPHVATEASASGNYHLVIFLVFFVASVLLTVVTTPIPTSLGFIGLNAAVNLFALEFLLIRQVVLASIKQ